MYLKRYGQEGSVELFNPLALLKATMLEAERRGMELKSHMVKTHEEG